MAFKKTIINSVLQKLYLEKLNLPFCAKDFLGLCESPSEKSQMVARFLSPSVPVGTEVGRSALFYRCVLSTLRQF